MSASDGARPRLPVILSAVAGRDGAAWLEPWMRQRLDSRFRLEFDCPGSLDALRASVRRAAADAPVVAVAGGDGTLHHAINALGDAGATLAPLPVGSGNDFCRGVGLTSLEIAVQALAGGCTRRVDLLEINRRRVATVGGIGVVAASALHAGRLMAPGAPGRRLLRPLSSFTYLGLAGVRLLLQPRTTARMAVEWRDPEDRWHEIQGWFHGAFLANLPTLGAGLRLPVPSRPDDGRFELALLPANHRLRLLAHLPRLRGAHPVPADILQVVHATSARIEWTGGTPVAGDGEDLGLAERVNVRVLPAALRIPAPGGQPDPS